MINASSAQELKIRLYGDPCLRKKSKPVESIGPAERMLIASMIKTMHLNQGVGLAAPQVGINEQIFVADIGDGPMAVINPKITKTSGSEKMEEGCLSIPDVQVNVKRPQKIKVTFLNQQNRNVEMECEDLLARVILHETDHLKGKLITDYAGLAERLRLKKKLQEIEKRSKQNSS